MILYTLADFLRVTLAFSLIFGLVPWCVMRFGWRERSLSAFAAAFAQVVAIIGSAALLLGLARLCLPGSMLAASFAFLVIMLIPALSNLTAPKVIRLAALAARPAVLRRIARSRLSRFAALEFDLDPQIVSLAALSSTIALGAFVHPAQFFRFLDADSYTRALSLQILTHGQPWKPDGSVAFLAPVVFLSGADGATVLRLVNPLLAGLLSFSAGIAVLRFRGSSREVLTAAGIVPLVAGLLTVPGEPGAGAGAAIFWLTAIALYRYSRAHALCAAGAALLVSLPPDLLTMACVGAAFTPSMFRLVPLPAAVRERTAWASLVPAAVFMILAVRPLESDGPHQYESSARAAAAIARERQRNTWLVISPVQELAITYGRGWHMELSEFVDNYQEDQVRPANFRFPFPVQDIFVMIEKNPLAREGVDSLDMIGRKLDPALAAYHWRPSRAAIQFSAGRLAAAYAEHHSGVEIFYQDQNLLVYRIADDVKNERQHKIGVAGDWNSGNPAVAQIGITPIGALDADRRQSLVILRAASTRPRLP